MTDEGIPDDHATRALERAAQLQLEAAERAERSTTAAGRRQGLTRDDLLQAAAEAGIEPRFVELALREQALSGAVRGRASDAALMRWLGTRQRSLSVSRVFDAGLAATVAACCRVFEAEKVGLELRGEAEPMHPDVGGTLEFHMARLSHTVASTGKYSHLAYRMEQLEMWTLHACFRPLGARTEVVLVGDLRSGAYANLRGARIGGALGGGAGLAAGAALGMVFPAALLGVAGAAVIALACRALYQGALRKTKSELENILAAVAGALSREALLDQRVR